MENTRVAIDKIIHLGSDPVPTVEAIFEAFFQEAKKNGCTKKVVGDYAYKSPRRSKGFYKMCKYKGYSTKTGDMKYVIKFVR